MVGNGTNSSVDTQTENQAANPSNGSPPSSKAEERTGTAASLATGNVDLAVSAVSPEEKTVDSKPSADVAAVSKASHP